MSDRRWQTGLNLYQPESYGIQRSFSRWIFEFLTKVVGWSDVDSDDAGWDSVIASGSDGATDATLTNRFSSASAPFTSSHNGALLTITGIGSPNEEKNGIYYIQKVISSTEVELDIAFSVHTDGLPTGLSGLSWRLWKVANTTSYVPAHGAVAVMGGRGKTGAGLTDGTGTGDSFSLTGTTITFTDAAANFQTHDVGKDIVITGATTPGNNGTFTITSRISATQITYENASGATEAFPGTWQIRYTFHFHHTVGIYSWDPHRFGDFVISPWPTWNPGTNSWDDSRHTGALSQYFYQPCERILDLRIWAVADPDCATFYMRTVRYIDGQYAMLWSIYQVGEIDAFYPEFDPRPIICMIGNARYDYNHYAIGTGYNWSYGPNGYIRFMSYDEVTTVAGYLMFPHSPFSTDFNWLSRLKRSKSEWSKKIYRMPLVLEGRASGHQELRGTLRHMSYIAQTQNFQFEPFGATRELINIGGLVFPWNQSKQYWELADRAEPISY